MVTVRKWTNTVKNNETIDKLEKKKKERYKKMDTRRWRKIGNTIKKIDEIIEIYREEKRK